MTANALEITENEKPLEPMVYMWNYSNYMILCYTETNIQDISRLYVYVVCGYVKQLTTLNKQIITLFT